MSQPQTTIAKALQLGIQRLGNSPSPKLDSEILLLKVINEHSPQSHTKTWLLTWPEKTLTDAQLQQYERYLDLRSQGMPIAYITGEKDFWTLTLHVTPATLIPRPETELLVECVLEKITAEQSAAILDMGTGSGAIALALASELSNCQIVASDVSMEALKVAQDNARRLHISNVRFYQSHWFEHIPVQAFDIICSNPPYIALQDQELEVNVKKYEPLSALHSGDRGLDDIEQIIRNSPRFLKPGGWLLFEHGYQQSEAVQALLQQHRFSNISTRDDLNHLPRVSLAQHP